MVWMLRTTHWLAATKEDQVDVVHTIDQKVNDEITPTILDTNHDGTALSKWMTDNRKSTKNRRIMATTTTTAISKQFYCPHGDDGYYVTDCLNCDGYLSTDRLHSMCFHRRLFAKQNADVDDPNHHYHYFWRDVIGLIAFFFFAGMATACGVGGGGMYVPLGMLVLQFAPKPSTGLSQASIFGASLGGLILHIQDQHPYTTTITTAVVPPGNNPNGNHEGENPTNPCIPAEAKVIDSHESSKFPIMTGQPNGQGLVATTKIYSRPLIDYDIALFLAPMQMAGAVVGVLIQRIISNGLYLTLTAIILGFTCYTTFGKWWTTRQAEQASATTLAVHSTPNGSLIPSVQVPSPPPQPSAPPRNGSAPLEPYIAAKVNRNTVDSEWYHIVNETTPLRPAVSSITPTSAGGVKTMCVSEDSDEDVCLDDCQDEGETAEPGRAMQDEEFILRRRRCRQQFLLEQDARQYPSEKLIALGILGIGLILLTFLNGGKGVESVVGITYNSPWYAVMIGIQLLWTLGFGMFFGLKLVRMTEEKQAVRYPFLKHDVVWDVAKLRFYAFFTFLSGIVAGLIGIGGGMVLGPLMLVMDIHPRVSSATTATMIVMTSSSVAMLFVISGMVPWEYAMAFFINCFAGAYVGTKYIDDYVKRTGRASLLILLLATNIGLALLGILVIALSHSLG